MEKPVLENELDVKIEGTQKVTNNIKEIKEYAVAMKDYYSTLVFNDTQVKDAKAERASVNKIVKKISDYRESIVAEFNRPLDEFVSSAKEAERLLKEASGCIDFQVKKFENIEKQKKKDECEEVFNSMIGDLADLITFEKIFDPRWLNKGTKMSQVESDIKAIIEKVNTGLDAIKELNSEFETEVISTFLVDYDLSKAIMRASQLKAQKEALEKTKVAKEETKQEIVKEMISKPVEDEVDERSIIKTYTLRITANYTKLTALKRFMEINDIKFEKVQ